MRIRHLPNTLINQIAAGEVVERPSAVVKELVENAIDAKASSIEIRIENGGKSLISIQDDGEGMSRDELIAALDRHATSKLPSDDLLNILHLGFRGEALPSIASVSRMSIDSFSHEEQEGWKITCEGGNKGEPAPSSRPKGTKVEVRDLFYATPARLKFLKTDRSESQAVKDIISRLAMTVPQLAIRLDMDGKTIFNLPSQSEQERLFEIMGRDFSKNVMPVEAEREGVHLTGWASLPTLNRGNSLSQFLFVNGRAVKDRLLLGAIKGAYSDVIARDRFPMAVLFLTLPPQEVDVNVHPAKAEVRFRDAAMIRGMIVSALRHGIHQYSTRTADVGEAQAVSYLSSASLPRYTGGGGRGYSSSYGTSSARNNLFQSYTPSGFAEPQAAPVVAPTSFENMMPSARYEQEEPAPVNETDEYPLGAARAQIHENYIIAQSKEGLVIIDQHAAHERLVYERLKAQQDENGIVTQRLLVPELIEMSDKHIDLLLEEQEALSSFGLEIEAFGNGTLALRSVPSLLGEKADFKQLMNDLADELEEHGTVEKIKEELYAILSRTACHGSIRSGRRMQVDEMNHLLREMESTPLSGQCNHGRPTYVKLSLAEIEKLFKRT
jgi:DNA mismatch repair protein MutL